MDKKLVEAKNNGFAGEIKLDELYQEVILDHNRRPRNFHKLEGANAYSHGVNPLCGDDYELYLLVDECGIIKKVSFEGHGCAISKSSASIMTTMIEGKSLKEAGELEKDFMRLLAGSDTPESVRMNVGRLKIFEGVKRFPVRVKCATLIWHALADALKDKIKG
ncbi:MAG: SUF system NifU family Fe-S cluster assembly protein [Candidatus Omnitrophica bacterium CG1_02_46_14]|nr:MAG: SUF system NifU family Fe-S cluster assembly protein [Candidatus Omnitrophica bacterium CG1_02_46_14]